MPYTRQGSDGEGEDKGEDVDDDPLTMATAAMEPIPELIL